MKPKSRLTRATVMIRRTRRLLVELTALLMTIAGLVAVVLAWVR